MKGYMQSDAEDDGILSCKEVAGMPTEFTRTICKAYRFFHDGHIQGTCIKFYPTYAQVLSSIRKDRK